MHSEIIFSSAGCIQDFSAGRGLFPALFFRLFCPRTGKHNQCHSAAAPGLSRSLVMNRCFRANKMPAFTIFLLEMDWHLCYNAMYLCKCGCSLSEPAAFAFADSDNAEHCDRCAIGRTPFSPDLHARKCAGLSRTMCSV